MQNKNRIHYFKLNDGIFSAAFISSDGPALFCLGRNMLFVWRSVVVAQMIASCVTLGRKCWCFKEDDMKVQCSNTLQLSSTSSIVEGLDQYLKPDFPCDGVKQGTLINSVVYYLLGT